MKPLVPLVPLALAVCLAAAAPLQEAESPARTDPKTWLQQLVGEWEVTTEADMDTGPGVEPFSYECTESVRAVGDQWIVAETSADFDGGPFTALMTLGYDTRKEAFVGTWIDTMQTHMWVYRGFLDESGKTLTLEAEGPDLLDPSKDRLYRDVITVLGPDQKRLVSSARMDDGTWTEFLTMEYRRKD